MSKKEVAVVDEKQQALAVAHDYGAMAGEGFETMSAKDLSIPFITVVQTNSTSVDQYGASAGELFNTVTGEVFDGEKGIVFQPCFKQVKFIEWVPLDDGGGLVAVHEPDSDVVKQAIAANGGSSFGDLKVGTNDLVETHQIYGLILDDEGKDIISFAVLAASSTKIKPIKNWFTAMYTIKGQPPLFANRARIKTVKQKSKNFTYHNLKVEPFNGKWVDGLIDPKTQGHLLTEAQQFKQMVESGAARAAYESMDPKEAETSPAGEENAPF